MYHLLHEVFPYHDNLFFLGYFIALSGLSASLSVFLQVPMVLLLPLPDSI